MIRSRRAVLQTVGIGLTALAGCTALEGRNESPSFDADALVALGERQVPEPPRAFPLSLPKEMVSRHMEQARTLIDVVPPEPDLPNEAVVDQLQEKRHSLVDRLADVPAEEESEAAIRLRDLRAARRLREEVAALEAAYRAATDGLPPARVGERRDRLRTNLREFEEEWTYRGDNSTNALLVHTELEDLRWEVQGAIDPERAFPEAPSTDVFRAGQVVGTLERGQAALADAERLRSRYLDQLTEPVSYRSRISIAAANLRGRTQQYGRTLEGYVEQAGADSFPFGGSIEDTPLERLYYRAAAGVQSTRPDAERARYRGDQATALLETGKTLARVRALDAIVTDIRTEAVGPPDTVEDLRSLRQDALAELEAAWETAPVGLSASLAHWAWVLIEEARDHLKGTRYEDEYRPDANDAHHAFANYVTAGQLAAAVPRTVDDIQTVL